MTCQPRFRYCSAITKPSPREAPIKRRLGEPRDCSCHINLITLARRSSSCRQRKRRARRCSRLLRLRRPVGASPESKVRWLLFSRHLMRRGLLYFLRSAYQIQSTMDVAVGSVICVLGVEGASIALLPAISQQCQAASYADLDNMIHSRPTVKRRTRETVWMRLSSANRAGDIA